MIRITMKCDNCDKKLEDLDSCFCQDCWDKKSEGVEELKMHTVFVELDFNARRALRKLGLKRKLNLETYCREILLREINKQ